METVKVSQVKHLIQDKGLSEDAQNKIMSELHQISAIPDTPVYRYVVIFLGLAIFIPLVPVIMRDPPSSQMLLPIATGALGALAGLLAPSPMRDS